MEETLSEKAYIYIRSRLRAGKLPPGKQLVNRKIAAEIGVSVIPVREAIHRLATEGLVEYVPGAGAFVRNVDREQLDNLYVLRDALESCAAGEAAHNISRYQLQELEQIVAEAEEIAQLLAHSSRPHATKRQLNAWLDTEERFHDLLFAASHNPLLAKVAQEHSAISQIFGAQRYNAELLNASVAKETCEGKRELIAALQDRDSVGAKALMSDQIQRGRRQVMAHLRAEKKSLPN